MLHGAAELLLAGPQHRAQGTIRLRVDAVGIATTAGPDRHIDGGTLVAGDRRIRLAGTTYAGAGAAAGIEAGAPAGVYHEGSGLAPEDPVDIDPVAGAYLVDRLALGDRALRRFAPDLVPVLWPEHFDVGIVADEVNYGVSPGDATIPEPYAYVGPWQPRTGPFWNVPFGAAVPLRDLPDDAAVAAFFAQGRDQARQDPPAGIDP
jgi:hypothetical protein